MKKYPINIIGTIIGLIISIVEAMVSYSDTAQLDDDFGIEIISRKFLILKIIIYSFLGWVLGYLLLKLSPFLPKGAIHTVGIKY